MENFTFYSPTFFVFGKDTENEAGSYVKKFGGSKVLIHYGGGSVVRSGLLKRVTDKLDEETARSVPAFWIVWKHRSKRKESLMSCWGV